MKKSRQTSSSLEMQIKELRARLKEAEETLKAIRTGAIDALVVSGPKGEQVFTLEGADYPYRIFVETMKEGAVTLAADGTILYCNRYLAELLKTPLESVTGSSFYNFVAQNDRPALASLLQAGRKGVAKGEIFLGVQNDQVVPVYLSISALKCADGENVCILVTDLSDQRRDEEIVASERLARSIIEQASEAIVVCDVRGLIRRASMAAHWLCQENPIAKSFDDLFPLAPTAPLRDSSLSDKQPAEENPLESRRENFSIISALQGEYFNNLEVTFKRKDKEVLYLLLNAGPLIGPQGRIIGSVATMTDITAHKQGDEVRSRLAGIVDSSNYAIFGRNLDGVIFSWNAGAETLFGYSAGEAIGQSLPALIPPEHADELPRFLELIKRGEHVDQHETVRMRKDGRRIEVSLSICPVRDSTGKTMGMSAIAHDITRRKQSERERALALANEQEARAQAEAASQAKDEFLATLSHELRTPLTSMLGWSRLLRMGNLDQATYARALEAIDRNAKAQAQLIEDLLDVSCIITGKLRIEARPVDLVAVIQAALDVVRPTVELKPIQLQTKIDPAAGSVIGDPNRLQQVIWNLLSNAVKFTSPGGRVTVTLEPVDSNVHITVHDTGIGIRAEFLPHLFERFQQADVSSARAYTGLGLGLATVRHLVELHGGTVQAESPGEGRGSTFRVILPPAYAQRLPHDFERQDESYDLPRNPTILAGIRVLVVDDEADARVFLSTSLEQYGAEVRLAASADEALQMLGGYKPNLLISDIGMPGKDGFALVRGVRALEKDQAEKIPAIALTAYARIVERDKILAAGYQLHLAKPIDPAKLISFAASLVGRASKSRSAGGDF